MVQAPGSSLAILAIGAAQHCNRHCRHLPPFCPLLQLSHTQRCKRVARLPLTLADRSRRAAAHDVAQHDDSTLAMLKSAPEVNFNTVSLSSDMGEQCALGTL